MLNHNKMPGAGSIADTMEFMRKMWGSMGAPAMGIPSLSVEEINKKIADLKTVASWLELNMNMLRATIQTLEVQSATLSTLQAMGAILTPREGAATASEAASATSLFGGFPAWPPQGSAQPAADAAPETEEEPEAEPEPAREAETPQAAKAKAGQKPASPSPDFQASMANPNAWWNLLQEQFQQAVGNVLADQGPAGKDAKPVAATTQAAQKKTTKSKTAAKPRTRAKSTVVQSRQAKPASRKPKSP